jgi:hypothetical protein
MLDSREITAFLNDRRWQFTSTSIKIGLSLMIIGLAPDCMIDAMACFNPQ